MQIAFWSKWCIPQFPSVCAGITKIQYTCAWKTYIPWIYAYVIGGKRVCCTDAPPTCKYSMDPRQLYLQCTHTMHIWSPLRVHVAFMYTYIACSQHGIGTCEQHVCGITTASHACIRAVCIRAWAIWPSLMPMDTGEGVVHSTWKCHSYIACLYAWHLHNGCIRSMHTSTSRVHITHAYHRYVEWSMHGMNAWHPAWIHALVMFTHLGRSCVESMHACHAYMYVCMYVCMYVYIYIYIYIYMRHACVSHIHGMCVCIAWMHGTCA